MCELFGFTGRDKAVLNDYLREFFSHSQQHPSGWGMTILDEEKPQIIKEVVKASDSLYLKERLKQPILGQNVFAHIRLATIGNVEECNTHPFKREDVLGQQWTLIHNGTIFECKPMEKYCALQEGHTDSERLLLYILELVNHRILEKRASLELDEKIAIFDQVLAHAAPGNKLNFMVHDGRHIFVHTNYKDSLFYKEIKEGLVISTRPLDDGKWERVPFTRLVIYENGRMIYQGESHGEEYFEDPEKMKLLFLAFSGL